LILTLERSHLGQIADHFPSARGKAYLLSLYADKKGAGDDVPDPAGQDLIAYRQARDQILRYIERIAEKI